MKKNLLLALAVAAVTLPSAAQAATVTNAGPFPVTAIVSQLAVLSCTVLQNNTGTAVAGNAMNFGTLNRPTDPVTGAPLAQVSAGFFQAYCTVNSTGTPYTLTQTGTPLASGANTIPANAYVFTPVSATSNPAGSTVGPAATAAGTATWATSTSGVNGFFQATYGITDSQVLPGPNNIVTPGQPAGTYTGTVTWTLTAQ